MRADYSGEAAADKAARSSPKCPVFRQRWPAHRWLIGIREILAADSPAIDL
jgi:hypothetical protein